MKVQNVVYVIDADSGWEKNEDVMWIIDEGNGADWAYGIAYVIK